MDTLIFLAVAAAVTCLTLIGFYTLSRGAKQVEGRLQERTGSDPMIGGSTPELLLGDLTPAMAGQIPISEADRTSLERELRSAGYYRPTALMEYAALRGLLVVVPLLGAAVLALFFTESLNTGIYVWVGGIILAILGYSIPRVYLYYRARARMHAIERGLPTAIDMLTLCLGAGLNVLTSVRRVAQELHLPYPILADEMEIVSRQAELRTLEFALAQFAERVGLPQVRNISVILTQSENLGTDAVSILREYADNMRINQRQRAEELANKAPFKLLFPAYLLAFGAAIFLIAPTALEFSEFQKSNLIQNSIRQAREVLERPALPPGATPPGEETPAQ
jgi:tight adherence protein C